MPNSPDNGSLGPRVADSSVAPTTSTIIITSSVVVRWEVGALIPASEVAWFVVAFLVRLKLLSQRG